LGGGGCETIGTAATPGLLCQPRVIVKMIVESRWNVDWQGLYNPNLFFSFVIFFTRTVGILGRVISQSQGRYLHIGQHKHRINAYTLQTSMSWMEVEPTIRTFERAKTVRGHYDRLTKNLPNLISIGLLTENLPDAWKIYFDLLCSKC
jgi:hypothetical protein